MNRKIIISIIILTFSFSLIYADDYSLDELIKVGLEKSYDIQQEMVNHENSKSYLRSSLYEILPSATISAGSSQNFDAADPDWNDSASLSLSKTIALNEPTYFNIRSSLLDRKNADHALDETRKQIAYAIFTYYLDVLQAQETLQIQQKNLELQQKIHQQIQVQYTAGDKSLLELKQSEVSLIDYEIAVNEAVNLLSRTRKDLFTFLNVKDKGNDFMTPQLEISEQDVEFETNNTLEQKKNSLKGSDLSMVQTALGILPSITLSYNLLQSDSGDVYDSGSYLRTNNSLGVAFTWNLFGILTNTETYYRTKRNNRLKKLDLELSRREYSIELENLKKDLTTYKKSYELYTEKLSLAQENLKMAQEQFKLGMISLLDLDRSKIDFQNAQLSHINSHYDLMKKHEEINLLLSNPILGKW